jgi:hypothetical protein
MVRVGHHNWLIIKSKKSNSEKAMGLGCKRHDFVAQTHELRPLQNSLFKICSFHHIFVPL